jgi:peptidoglycan/xylan/chitin deacetylase (PgdA/CDA1 family)
MNGARNVWRIVRRAGKKAIGTTASKLPVHVLTRVTGLRALVPFYHVVTDKPPPYLVPAPYRFPDVGEFEKKLDYLLGHFVPLSLAELQCTLREGQRPAKLGFHLTFDDGYREVFDVVAPILLRKGIPATFFVCSAFIDNQRLQVEHKAALILNRLSTATAGEKYAVRETLRAQGLPDFEIGLYLYGNEAALDEAGLLLGLHWDRVLAEYKPYLDVEQLRLLVAQGFTVGAHSIDHPRYDRLPLQEQLRQTQVSMEAVRSRLQLPYRAFAIPFTDIGIKRDFFESVFKQGMVDMLFCTREMMEDEFAERCVHRLWMEISGGDGDRYLRAYLANKLIRRLWGSDCVRRLA